MANIAVGTKILGLSADYFSDFRYSKTDTLSWIQDNSNKGSYSEINTLPDELNQFPTDSVIDTCVHFLKSEIDSFKNSSDDLDTTMTGILNVETSNNHLNSTIYDNSDDNTDIDDVAVKKRKMEQNNTVFPVNAPQTGTASLSACHDNVSTSKPQPILDIGNVFDDPNGTLEFFAKLCDYLVDNPVLPRKVVTQPESNRDSLYFSSAKSLLAQQEKPDCPYCRLIVSGNCHLHTIRSRSQSLSPRGSPRGGSPRGGSPRNGRSRSVSPRSGSPRRDYGHFNEFDDSYVAEEEQPMKLMSIADLIKSSASLR